MRALALLGGPQGQWPEEMKKTLATWQAAGNLLIGVDRGSLLLDELGLVPDIAVGDFDSLQASELDRIEQEVADIRYSVPEKDYTDTELAVKYAFLDYQVDELTMLGATGGRLDHFLTNLLMVNKPEFNAYAERIKLIDRQNWVSFYNPGQHSVKRQIGCTYFGVAPLTAVSDLNINQAKYNLAHYQGTFALSLSSNEFLPGQDTFELSFAKGVVAVIQSKDIDRYQNI